MASAFASANVLVRGRYRFAFRHDADGLRVRIDEGQDVMDLPLEWAFGAGRQAVTFVTSVNRDWYVEHYASFYPKLNGYAATPGQGVLRPANLREAAGVLYQINDPVNGIASCFECHSTGPASFGEGGQARLTEAGVHCEACHGPGSEHARDPARHSLFNPGKLSASGINEFCGNCHRAPTKGAPTDWNYAWNVRHAPVYLAESRCFRKGNGALSCLTCHGPHEAVGANTLADYNAPCRGCHAQTKMPPNCVDCHMPLVSPQAPLRFTNHWIGVYKASGSKLKPTR
jgi:predicted CXXCH cytochrome family protein